MIKFSIQFKFKSLMTEVALDAVMANIQAALVSWI